jgi:hypothetical protein
LDASFSNPPATLAVRLTAAGGIVFAGAASALVWYFDPSKFNFFPVCPLFSITGFACPGCGLTRGFHALLHGDVVTALGFNALLPFYLLLFGFLLLSLLLVAVRGRGLVSLNSSPKYLIGFLFVMIAFGVVRNIPVYPFTLMFP